MTEPQRIRMPAPVEARLRKYITAETAHQPIDVRYVWTGHGRGVVSYAYGDDTRTLRAAALPIEGDIAHEIRVLEVGGPLITDTHPQPTNPEWVDVERLLAELGAAEAGIVSWNEQIEAAAEIARASYDRGHGVIVSLSRNNNTVEARESVRTPAGTAYVFDLDRINPTPDLAFLSRIDPKDLR